MNIKSAHFLPGTNKRLGDKYLLLECLGDGSHGWVWRAERRKKGKKIAVKKPQGITSGERQPGEGKKLFNRLFFTTPRPPEKQKTRMPSSALKKKKMRSSETI